MFEAWNEPDTLGEAPRLPGSDMVLALGRPSRKALNPQVHPPCCPHRDAPGGHWQTRLKPFLAPPFLILSARGAAWRELSAGQGHRTGPALPFLLARSAS